MLSGGGGGGSGQSAENSWRKPPSAGEGYASSEGDHEIVRFKLDNGVDVNTRVRNAATECFVATARSPITMAIVCVT